MYKVIQEQGRDYAYLLFRLLVMPDHGIQYMVFPFHSSKNLMTRNS